MAVHFATSLVVTILANTVAAGTYLSTSNLVGQGLLDAFYWQTMSDPSHGRVNYVSESTAQSSGLVSVSGNQVTLRADSTNVLNPSGPGRNSFRLETYDQYTTHVAVFDIAHMPEGCGTWPEVGDNWPSEGEIDIIEGVNSQGSNLFSFHTGGKCSMPSSRSMTGNPSGSLDCDVYDTNDTGCSVSVNDPNNFGPSFNRNGGGWYAIERTPSFVKMYFWERGSSSVPSDVQYPGSSVNPDNWGTPTAYYPNTDCDFSSQLGAQNIIINLTFCGDWAGNSGVWASSGCPSDCVDYVNNNPSAFGGAYFTFKSINIYE
ncbi:glycoside hydrolase family 16 protein [Scleroderma citrinum Foug A]|uniref:Glycoside hydrolase family 16 protein n=1 Tax=Scleroderma citrinum Foug A TaxID=1036808 RepID=A0A0C3DCB4_9AGAM|nr:glycoside hydrolase family 16 protein [Scleroderma citrinum Foug A]